MKGKYICTSLVLAVLAGTKEGLSLHVHETQANPQDHQLIWTKSSADNKIKEKGELNPA